MNKYVLRLLEDTLPPACDPVFLPACNRTLLVMSGALTVETATGSLFQGADSVWIGSEAVTYLASKDGAQVLRWELVSEESAEMHDGRLRSAPKAQSTSKLVSDVTLDPGFAWLMRCDRVSFPVGGEALLHVHQGPGTRCVVRGSILIDSAGHQHSYSPGQAWFEEGIDVPVYAPASKSEETAFVRCMFLPRALKGRSSVRYVRREDDDRPKSQSYFLYGERFIELPAP